MINILQKHAIWCQCVTIFHVAITLACISSFQNITKGPDIFWSTVCVINTIVLFVEAEHAPIVFTTDTWQTINNYREKIIWSVFATFNGPKNPLIYQCFAILLIFICFQKLPFLWSISIFGISFFWGSWSVKLLFCIYVFAIYQRHRLFHSVINQSIAGTNLKKAYAAKSIHIFLEGIFIWYLRCLHRFPHEFRWKNVFIGMVAVFLSFLYCSFRVKKTKTSRNAIIKSYGHGMAASLTAAKACPVCRQCLTALDMESSFGDG
jgi:hypothetical protein